MSRLSLSASEKRVKLFAAASISTCLAHDADDGFLETTWANQDQSSPWAQLQFKVIGKRFIGCEGPLPSAVKYLAAP